MKTTNNYPASTVVEIQTSLRARRKLIRAILVRSVMAAASLAGAAVTADRAVAQSTYGWNTTSGTWNTTSANWAGQAPYG
jgi:hypothetical protein